MNDEVRKLFNENLVGALATINQDGSPRATPVHLVTDGEAVYWFSSHEAEHSQNIERDARASVTLFSPDLSQGPRGVYISGGAELLSAADTEPVRQRFTDRVGIMPKAFESYVAYKLLLGELDEQKSTGKCWYFYSR